MSNEVIAFPVEGQEHTVIVQLEKHYETADALVAQAERAEITDAASYAKGGDLMKIARTHEKGMEDERKAMVGPFNRLVKAINAAYKKPQYGQVAAILKPKMLDWKREEDARLRKEAEERARKLEEEALRKAEAEAADADQDAVLDAAADAAKEVVENSGVGLQRGEYGSSTGTRKVYNTEVRDLRLFVAWLATQDCIDLGAIIDLKKSGLNALAKEMVSVDIDRAPGATFTETENLSIY